MHVNQTFIDIQWVTTLTALPHACHNYACAHSWLWHQRGFYGEGNYVNSLLSIVFAIIYYSFHSANAVLIPLTTHPLMHTMQESEKDSPCKAADQPLPCSAGVVCYLCHQHSIYWCTGTLRAGLRTDALLLPGCLLLDGSRSHSLAQETGNRVQTRHQKLRCHHCGNLLG